MLQNVHWYGGSGQSCCSAGSPAVDLSWRGRMGAEESVSTDSRVPGVPSPDGRLDAVISYRHAGPSSGDFATSTLRERGHQRLKRQVRLPALLWLRLLEERTSLSSSWFAPNRLQRLCACWNSHILVTSDPSFDAGFERLAAKLNTTAVLDGAGGDLISRTAPRLPPNSTVWFYGFLAGATPVAVSSLPEN